MTATQLPAPLWLMTTNDETSRVIQGWAQESLRPRQLTTRGKESGTILLRTGSIWNSMVAATCWNGTALTPIVVFKNSVALWQSPRVPVADGAIDLTQWVLEVS